MFRLQLLTAVLVAAHGRQPPSPSPLRSLTHEDEGSGPAAASPPPDSLGPQKVLCNVASIEHFHTMSSCTLDIPRMYKLSELMRRAKQAELTWLIAFVVSLMAVLLLALFVTCSYCRRRRTARPPPQVSSEADKKEQGIKIIYMRPDAWPMQVVDPSGDSVLAMPVDATELNSEFFTLGVDWVRMESPFTSSSRSSSSSSSREPPLPSPSSRRPTQHAQPIASRLARVLFSTSSPSSGERGDVELQGSLAQTSYAEEQADEDQGDPAENSPA